MANRREVLAGLLAVGIAPRASWADAGSPDYLTAARRPDRAYTLCGLTEAGTLVFEVPLPGRGHAAAAHPTAPLAVAFARRPGQFALVIDCATGQQVARLDAPDGRHFYGHGAFSADGRILYTTENDFGAARGMIGLWAASEGFRRIGEVASGGVGPHEMLRLPGRDDLVIANGGIETHPDTGRAKLNLPLMRPNLTYLSPDGAVRDQVELDRALHQNSIRHLDAMPSGEVAFAMQWEGPNEVHPPLLGRHRQGTDPDLFLAPDTYQAQLEGYAGSVAFSQDGTAVAITSPRGGVVHAFSAETGDFLNALNATDVCGIAAGNSAPFAVTTGIGVIGLWEILNGWASNQLERAFDNHLIKLG